MSPIQNLRQPKKRISNTRILHFWNFLTLSKLETEYDLKKQNLFIPALQHTDSI